MKSIRASMILVGAFLVVVAVQAKDHAGFKKQSHGVTRNLEDSVVRYVETDDEIKILFKTHAAFYRFPKSVEVKAVLDQRIRDKKPVKATVDAVSRKIISLSSSSK